MNQSQPEPELEQPESTGDAALDFLNKRDAEAEAAAQPDPEQEPEDDALPEQEEVATPDQQAAEDLAWLQNKRKITVQGEEIEVTADDAFKGYMRDEDYRRKTAHAAELTRQAEQERQYWQQERENRVNQLDIVAEALFRELGADERRLPEMIETDPVGYLRLKQHCETVKAQLQQAANQRQMLTQQQQQEDARAQQAYVLAEQKKLQEKLPEWRDPTVKAAESEAIGRILLDAGYDENELNMLTDHRALLIARDAMRWRKQQEIRAKQTQTPAKPVQSGSRNQPNKPEAAKLDALKARARRSGNADHMLAYLNEKGAS